jgi:phospholipid N-methyltransferase
MDSIPKLTPQRKKLLLAAVLTSYATGRYLHRHLDKAILLHFFKDPANLGEIAPFSAETAKALCAPLWVLLTQRLSEAHILEVGAGKGHLTKYFLKAIDQFTNNVNSISFDIVEMEANHIPDIEKLLTASGYTLGQNQPMTQPTTKVYTKNRVTVTLINMPFGQQFVEHFKQNYDLIISTIPEQSIPLAAVQEIYYAFRARLKPKGVLVRVRYVVRMKWIRNFFSKTRSREIADVAQLQDAFNHGASTTRKVTVYDNLPPVNIYYMTF